MMAFSGRAQLVADLGEELDLYAACFLGRVLRMPEQLDAAVGKPPHLALLEAILDGRDQNIDSLGLVDELASLVARSARLAMATQIKSGRTSRS